MKTIKILPSITASLFERKKCLLLTLWLFALGLTPPFGDGLSEVEAQNIGINVTGAAPSSANMLEVLQPSTTANTVGIYTKHSGAVGSGTAYGLQAIANGAGVNNVAAYLSATNGTTSNYALIVPSGGGNVGIGTTTPSSLLHVDGTARLGLASATNGTLIFNNSANANTITINSGVTATSHALTLPVAQGAANTMLTNDGSGNLSWTIPSGGGSSGGISMISTITASANINSCVAYCYNLTEGGFTDWRVPTVGELYQAIQNGNPSFPGGKCCHLWTASYDVMNGFWMNIDETNGGVSSESLCCNPYGYCRCVR